VLDVKTTTLTTGLQADIPLDGGKNEKENKKEMI
jgi:hypothetical protein